MDSLSNNTNSDANLLRNIIIVNGVIPIGDHSNMGPIVTKPKDTTTYFGIFISGSQREGHVSEYVYTDKDEALKVLKKNKKSRFKAFKNFAAAIYFAEHGGEPVVDSSRNTSGVTLGEQITSTSSLSGTEKSSLFRGPKPQELVKLRKLIESGNLEMVRCTVWDNPRYLVSSGDTPSILQEGSRYNALHFAAKALNAEMCELILQTVSNPEFLLRLYGEENISVCKVNSKKDEDATDILLDSYLNMPDKGLNETPLHFASKWGCYDVVKLLLSYPQCKMKLNKHGQLPNDIICQRANWHHTALIKKIALLFEEQYYVPVLRSEDNSVQPRIGEPFSPKTPPIYNKDILSPRIEIQALAGPMTKHKAEEFCKKWKTPPRSKTNIVDITPRKNLIRHSISDITVNLTDHYSIEENIHSSPLRFSTPQSNKRRLSKPIVIDSHLRNFGTPLNPSPKVEDDSYRFTDSNKGLERFGRKLAKHENVGWQEFWSFLGTFANLNSSEGLQLLEEYLGQLYIQKLYAKVPTKRNFVEEKQKKLSDSSFSDIEVESIISPISYLCTALNACHITQTDLTPNFKMRSFPSLPHQGQNLNNETELFCTLNNSGLSPFLCVEKSCQVFAKRIFNIFLNLDISDNGVIAPLKTEFKHLQGMICSFLEDLRFVSVNFQLVHSRVAKIISDLLINENMGYVDLVLIKDTIKSIGLVENIVERCTSDEEEEQQPFRPNHLKIKNYNKQIDLLNDIKCLSTKIISILNQDPSKDPDVESESQCMELWANATPCNCQWQSKHYSRATRKASFKRSSHLITTSSPVSVPKSKSSTTCSSLEKVSKRLFDEIDTSEFYGERSVSDNEDDDVFYTPPSSPTSLKNFSNANSIIGNQSGDESLSDGDEDMCDVEDEGIVIYMTGDKPTQIDLCVLQALSDVAIDLETYPNIYRWKHVISLYKEEEREFWPNASISFNDPKSPSTSRTYCQNEPEWVRITGVHSPRSKSFYN